MQKGLLVYNSPIAGADKLFMYNYDSFYQPSNDSLSLIPGLTEYMVEHEQQTMTDFVYKPLNDSLRAFQNGSLIESWETQGRLLNALFVSLDGVNSIFDTRQLDMKLYPNPFNSILNLTFEKAILLDDVRIYDVNGKLVKEIASPGLQTHFIIQLQNLTKGFYFIEGNTSEGKFRKKIIKY